MSSGVEYQGSAIAEERVENCRALIELHSTYSLSEAKFAPAIG